jgi:site-specific recombinase XerD
MLEKILDEYRECLKAENACNIQSRLFSISQFTAFLKDKGTDSWNITLSAAEEYKVHLSTISREGRYYHRGTINNKLSFLKDFYCWLQKKERVFCNPFADLKHLKGEDRLPKNILTEDEMEALFEGMELKTVNDIIFYVGCEVLYSCGLRISELGCLKVKDLLFERGVLRVTDAKSRKERFVPVNEYCRDLVRIYLDQVRPLIAEEAEGYLFPQSKGRTTLRCFMNRRLSGLAEKTGLKKKLTTHSFRHSMATALFKNGAGLRQVQSLLGHTNIRNTEIYTRISREDLKEVLKARHPRETLFQEKQS